MPGMQLLPRLPPRSKIAQRPQEILDSRNGAAPTRSLARDPGPGEREWEDDEKALSASSIAQRRAQRLGLSRQELLAHDISLLQSSSYPGDECLQPYEIELYMKGQLEHDRIAHAESCSGCGALLAALTPSEQRIAALLEEIREMAAVMPADGDEPVKAASSDTGSQRAQQALIRGAAMATAAAALAVVIPAVAPGLVAGRASTIALLMVALSCSLAALVKPSHLAWGLLRSSHGTRIGGWAAAAVAAIMIAAGAWLVWPHRAQPQIVAAVSPPVTQTPLLALTEATVKGIVASSYSSKLATGHYINAEYRGPVLVTSDLSPGEQAVYRASVKGLSSQIVVRLSSDSGELYVQGDDSSKLQPRHTTVKALLVMGIVKKSDAKGVVVESSGSMSHFATPKGKASPPVGHYVMAVLDATGKGLQSFYDLSEKGLIAGARDAQAISVHIPPS